MERPVRFRQAAKYVLGTVLAGLLLVGAGGLVFIYSGVYSLAATEPHLGIVRWALGTLQARSVAFHARGIRAPELEDPELIRRGVVLYGELCVVCHGAPGVEPDPVIGRGMNPNPPRLALVAPDYSDGEIYWIIRNGFKMAGMPGFETGHTERDLWSLTAFVRRIPELTRDEYLAMLAALAGTVAADAVPWLAVGDHGLARMRSVGNPERGRDLLADFGCGSCHVIPGVQRATGTAGPPLFDWSDRHYIAGMLLNNPDNLVRWIVDPQSADPGTVMPTLGVDSALALDMAAYLFTLGKGLPPSVAIDRPKGSRDEPAQP
jgi:mono/diheme cytochrome c family protein